MAVLKENVGDLSSLTAEIIQRGLENRLGVNLAGYEEEIEQVLKSVRDGEDVPAPSESVVDPLTDANAITPPLAEPEKVLRVKKSNVRKNFPFSKSDDEGDRDFDPKGSQKKQSKNLNRKKLKE